MFYYADYTIACDRRKRGPLRPPLIEQKQADPGFNTRVFIGYPLHRPSIVGYPWDQKIKRTIID